MTTKHFNQQQLEFMQACGQKAFKLTEIIDAYEKGYSNSTLVLQQISLWKELINEEVNRELFPNLQKMLYAGALIETNTGQHLCKIADDIADSVYVLCGLANCLGIPLHDIFEAVHSANMKKAIKRSDGTFSVTRRPDGKILKPNGWIGPEISIERILEDQIKEEIYDRS